MTDHYKITLIRGDKSLEISPESHAHLTEGGLRGFDAAGFDVSVSSYASRAGGYAQKRRFAERELSLAFEADRAADSMLRRQITSMLDPAADIELYIELGEVSRKITVIPCDEPIFSRPTFSDLTEITLYFVAPSVFFESAAASSLNLHDCAPLLTFPMNFTSEAGLTAGIHRTYGSGTVNNPGDGECGAVITISAIGGNVVHPSVSLGDKFISCPIEVSDGSTLVIDTRTGRKNITLDGERCFVFDKQSSFFSLPIGDSTVSVTSDSGGEFMNAKLEFYPIFFGV